MFSLFRLLLILGVSLAAQLETFVSNDDYLSFERYVQLNKQASLEQTFVSQIAGCGNLLHMIVDRNRANPSRFLSLALDIGLDINSYTRDDLLNTPLTLASRFGNVDAVNFLLGRGALVHVMNKNGRTPLMVALINNKFEIAELLIRAYESLFSAMTSHDEGVQLVTRLNSETDSSGHNLLFVAISGKATMGFMLDMAFRLNLFWAFPIGKTTCLMIACKKRDEEFVQLVLARPGVRDIIDVSNNGQTVLSSAISAKNTGMVRVLLEHGADPQLTIGSLESYLQQAINEDVPEEIIKLLLQYRVLLNVHPLYKQPTIISFAESRHNRRAKDLILQTMKFDDVAPLFLEHLPACLLNLIRTIYIQSL